MNKAYLREENLRLKKRIEELEKQLSKKKEGKKPE